MNNKQVISGIVAVLALAGVVYFKPTTVNVAVPQQGAPIVNVTTPEVKVPATVVNVPKQNAILNAVPTLDGVDNPNVTIGGLSNYYYNQQTQATSSVVCSVRNNYATTTIPKSIHIAGYNRMGTVLLDIATSTTQYGTSSPAFVKAIAIPTGRFDVIWGGYATTTSVSVIGFTNAIGVLGMNGATDGFIKSGEYLNFKIATSSGGVYANGYLVGNCGGVFEKI